MTISTEVNRIDRAGDGVTTSFSTSPMTFYNATDLQVYVTTNATGAAVQLTNGVDYSVTGGAGSTGSVVCNVAPAALTTVSILRVAPVTQASTGVNGDNDDAVVRQTAFDKVVLLCQQLTEKLARAVVGPANEHGANFTMPSALARANKFAAWDASGNLAALTGTFAGGVAIETLTQVVDTIAQLKALAVPGTAVTYLVRGYYAANDGGGGLFRWNASDARADDGGTIISANAGGNGRWDRIYDTWIRAAWFGVNASQAAAVNTSALNAAIAAGSVIELPAGTIDLNALNPITLVSKIIFGQGRGTLLRFNTTGKCFQFGPFGSPTQNKNLRMCDIAFTNLTNTPAAYISQENYTNSVFERLYWEQSAAGTYAIDQVSGYGTRIKGCVWHFFTGTPIRLRDNGAAPNYSYVAKIDEIDITSATGNGIEVEAANVLKISDSVIEGVTGDGIKTSTNSAGVSGGVLIETTDFESNGNDINLTASGGTYWGRATVLACNFLNTGKVLLGDKSKVTFIGIQGSSGITVTGSANAEAYFVGCEDANFTQSGAFAWTIIGGTGGRVFKQSKPAAAVNVDHQVQNTDNTSASSGARVFVDVGGSSAGDPYTEYHIAGVTGWVQGIDNSDAQSFKLSANSAALGTNDVYRVDRILSTFAFKFGTIAKRSVVPYSASMTIDASLGNEFDITANNGTAFTINAPTNPQDGQRITVTIRNTSGGALGAATWNAVFKMSAWTNPANANSRSIDFRYDGTNWVQVAQTGIDVPN